MSHGEQIVRDRRVLLEQTARAAIAVASGTATGSVLVFDADLHYVDAGGAGLERQGWDPALLRDRAIGDVLPRFYYDRLIAHYEGVLTGERTSVDLPSVDGATIFRCAFHPVWDAQGAVIGGFVVSDERPAAIRAAPRARQGVPTSLLLSERERDALRLASIGYTTPEIARELFLAAPTVETYIRRATRRLGARNRTHAVALALAYGEVDLAYVGDLPRPIRADDDARRPMATVFAGTSLPMTIVSEQGAILAANPAFEQHFGWPERDIRGARLLAFVDPDDRDRVGASLAALAADESAVLLDASVRQRHRTGSWRSTAWSASQASDDAPVDAATRPLSIVHSDQALTDCSAELLLRLVTADLPVAFYIKNRDFRYVFANRVAEDLLARPPGSLTARSDDEIFAPATAARLRANDRSVIERGESVHVHETVGRGGMQTVFVTAKLPLRQRDGTICGLIGISIPMA